MFNDVFRHVIDGRLQRRLSSLVFDLAMRLSAARITARLSGRCAEPGPVIVSGLLSRFSGIGRAGRLTVEALEATCDLVIRHDAEQALATRLGETLPFPIAEPGGLWIVHLNAPEAEKILSCYQTEDFATRRRVGYWAYELQPAPKSWKRVAAMFDEIWAPSQFTADAIRAVVPNATVRIVPHPTPDISGVQADRAAFGLPSDAVIFFCMFDTLSSEVRKNPFGAVNAYLTAFPQAPEGVMLLVKASCPPGTSPSLIQLLKRIKRPDIRLITDHFSDSEMLVLLASIDVLVSLHRAEGFGLALQEAMALGRPVIATGWSGNLEFMTSENSVLIGHQLISVDDLRGRYDGRGRVWAEPDTDEAAYHIRRLYDDAAVRGALGALAAKDATRNADDAEVVAATRANLACLRKNL